MSRTVRYTVNALLLLLIAGHAVWWFAMGRAALATDLQVWLRVAQAVVGFAGGIWFYSRARGAASQGP
jgi:hypothetical protein